MAKKTFKKVNDEDVVKEFFSDTEDNTEDLEEEKTNKESVKLEKKPIENLSKSKKVEAAERQGTLFDVPMKLEEAKKSGSFETKSKKFQMLIQPTVFNKIKEIAELRGEKINSYIHYLLEKAIKETVR